MYSQTWYLLVEGARFSQLSLTCSTVYASCLQSNCTQSPGRWLKTDEHEFLGPELLRNHLHSVRQICIKLEPRELDWVCKPHSSLHDAMATTVFHYLPGWCCKTNSEVKMEYFHAHLEIGKGVGAQPCHLAAASFVLTRVYLQDSDLLQENTTSAEVLMTHDCTHT